MSKNQSPFKFLDAYGIDDRKIFFGRDWEIDELYDRLQESNLVLLYGASGTGKTSLIKCGLYNLYNSTDWLPIWITKASEDLHILDQLEKALLQYWPKDKIDQWNKDWTLSQKIRQIYLIQFKPIYLIFDQFEELFTLGKEDEASTFFETLRALLSSQEQTKVLLSMREDYLAFLSDYEHIIPTLFDNRMRLEKMSKKNLTEVVISTAEYYNIQLEPEESAAEAIIEKLKDERGEVELANLQIFLDQLYRADAALRQKERNTERNIRFTLKAIQETKELEDVIGNFLDTQINKLEIDLRKKGNQVPNTPMTVLFTLVTNDGTKRSKQLEEVKTILEEKGITADIVDHCVKQFKEWRIIR